MATDSDLDITTKTGAAIKLVQPRTPSVTRDPHVGGVIFADPKSRGLLDQLERIGPTDAAVFIVGETGTGKEVIARFVHERSRRTGPFIAVNCGALSASLAEAELFGYQAGAFTGATETRAGWFEAAHEGTLFLDEVGDLPLSLQVKLLRVLQEREVVRVGSRKAIPIDVRLVGATNIDLSRAVAAGHFRLDLYYRLNVVNIELPPLRERRGDIIPLVDHFIRKYSQRLQLSTPTVLPETRNALLHYPWPGNIRELENIIHVALLISSDQIIRPEHLRFAAMPISDAAHTSQQAPADAIAAQLHRLFLSPPPQLYRQLEELIVTRAFEYCDQNQVHTARLLGVSRNILRTQLKNFGLIGNDTAGADTASETEDGDLSANPSRLQS